MCKLGAVIAVFQLEVVTTKRGHLQHEAIAFSLQINFVNLLWIYEQVKYIQR